MKNSNSRIGRRRNRNSSREPILGYYLIVTDTKETEKNYFEGLKNSNPETMREKIVIKVEKAKTTYNLVEKTIELCNAQAQQRIPWIIFDRDEVISFDKIIKEASDKNINVGWSNPCFEIWMFAYFNEMPHISDSKICCKKFADKYKKVIGQKYQKNDKDIYRKLTQYGNFKKAYQLAENNLILNINKKPSTSYPACTVHHLVKEISEKVNI